eukprot:1141730-Pelagomonas_calceolata.AAC.2
MHRWRFCKSVQGQHQHAEKSVQGRGFVRVCKGGGFARMCSGGGCAKVSSAQGASEGVQGCAERRVRVCKGAHGRGRRVCKGVQGGGCAGQGDKGVQEADEVVHEGYTRRKRLRKRGHSSYALLSSDIRRVSRWTCWDEGKRDKLGAVVVRSKSAGSVSQKYKHGSKHYRGHHLS